MDSNYIIETKKSDKSNTAHKECGGLKYPCQAWENMVCWVETEPENHNYEKCCWG